MKKNLVFVLIGVFVISASFFGCKKRDAQWSAAQPQVQQPEEVIVVETEEFSQEPSVRAETEEVFTLQMVHFEFDQSTLSHEIIEILRKNAQYLQNNPDVKVVVEGHCDNRGTVAYNLALGQRRAMRVKEYYVQFGITPNRVATISYGEEKPINPANNEGAWAENRRAETKVIL